MSDLLKSVAVALLNDGRIAELQFKLTSGAVIPVRFKAEHTSSVMLNLEQKLGEVFEKQSELLKGQDPRTMFPVAAKTVEKLQGAIATDGRPVLSMALQSGVRLDFALDQNAIPDLIDWLRELEAAGHQPPQKAN